MNAVVFGISVAGALLAIAIVLMIIQAVVTFVLGNPGVVLAMVAAGALLVIWRFWR